MILSAGFQGRFISGRYAIMPTQPRQAFSAQPISHARRAPEGSPQPFIYWPFVLAAASVALVLVVGLTAVLARVKIRPAVHQAEPPVAQADGAAESDGDLGTPPQVPSSPEATAEAAAPAQPAAANRAPQQAEPAQSALRLGASPGAAVGTARTPSVPREDRVADPLLPPPEDSIKAERAGENYGTQVAFLSSPAKASKQAVQDQKLMFVLHISGNFEDAKFT
jgi:hypothetical protein